MIETVVFNAEMGVPFTPSEHMLYLKVLYHVN